MSKSELKIIITLFLIFTVTFGSIMTYRSIVVDPVLDAVYSEVHGLDEEGEEW